MGAVLSIITPSALLPQALARRTVFGRAHEVEQRLVASVLARFAEDSEALYRTKLPM